VSLAEEQLVREHLPLVHYAANEVAARLPRHVAREDLVAAGMLGLAQAARSFDEKHGVTFARYARTRIKGAIIDELRSRDWASRSTRSKARTLQATSERLTAQLSRTPSLPELAAELGLDTAEVERLMDDVHRATVLNYDSIVTDGDGEIALPGMHESPEDVLATRERIAYLRDAVTSLPERLRHVVVGYFFEERPMQELADELGVSESRISQMRAEALELLREGVESQLEPESVPVPENPNGRIARRKAAYYASIAAASDFRTRLAASPVSVPERVASIASA
jgi:RNA polymerase sigma factor FliA